MRLSLLYGVRPRDVLGWSTEEISVLSNYLAREPAPLERIEVSLAASRADFYNANRGKNGRVKKIADFMAFRDVWKPEDVAEPQSIHALAMAMGGVKRADNHR